MAQQNTKLLSLGVSSTLYIFLFVCLSLITIPFPIQEYSIIIESLPVDNIEDKTIEIVDINTTDENISVYKQSGSNDNTSIPEFNQQISISDPNILLDNVSATPIASLVPSEDVNAVFNIEQNTVQDTSISGVLDRLTIEIINHAQQKEVNVIWLFDASVSLSQQRKNIADRFDKIIEEINQSENIVKKIQHTICSFGSALSVLNEIPTDNIKELISLIDSISIDDTGIENIFGSIHELCLRYKNQKNIIIAFTDEVGDDIDKLESTVFDVRKFGCSIYVVGPPAPFGIDKIQFRFKDPNPTYDQTEKWVEINQGPETFVKMTLDLHSLPIDEQALDSGFGPYGLSRLCADSGGIYFSMHPNRKKGLLNKKEVEPLSSYISVFFDNEVLKQYPPDYRNLLVQQKELNTNKIKAALVNACNIPIKITQDQTMNFSAFTEGEFVEQLNNAQRFAALIEPKIDQVYNILKPVESSARSLKDKRWLASYNLAIGRILATKCRIELYNNMLAEAKSGLKKTDPKNNLWTLEYSEDFATQNSQLNKTYKAAIKYLQSLLSDFPDTPWAFIAQQELNTPMGYRWKDSYKEPIKSKANNNNPNQVRKDDKKKTIDRKPQRQIDKI